MCFPVLQNHHVTWKVECSFAWCVCLRSCKLRSMHFAQQISELRATPVFCWVPYVSKPFSTPHLFVWVSQIGPHLYKVKAIPVVHSAQIVTQIKVKYTFPCQDSRSTTMIAVLQHRTACDTKHIRCKQCCMLTMEGLTAVIVQYESSFHDSRWSCVPIPRFDSFFVTWRTASRQQELWQVAIEAQGCTYTGRTHDFQPVALSTETCALGQRLAYRAKGRPQVVLTCASFYFTTTTTTNNSIQTFRHLRKLRKYHASRTVSCWRAFAQPSPKSPTN